MTMTEVQDYGAESIRKLDGLEYVRTRVSQYLTDTEAAGITHQIIEPLDNAFDEALTKIRSGESSPITVVIHHAPDNSRFQVSICDTGRGFPHDAIPAALTELNRSGKFDTKAYKYSAGLFGVGGKVCAATSVIHRTISTFQGAVASFTIRDGIASKELDAPPVSDPDKLPTGTIITFEPHPGFFMGIDTWMEHAKGLAGLLNIIQRRSLDIPYQTKVILVDSLVDEAFWDMDVLAARTYIATRASTGRVVFDSEKDLDPEQWIRNTIGITRTFTWSLHLQKTTDGDENLLASVRLHWAKGELAGGTIGSVNTVAIDRPDADHIAVVTAAIRQHLAPKISDVAVSKFFVTQYRLPLIIVSNVLFSGAQFTGATKHMFTSAAFRAVFSTWLAEALSEPNAAAAMDTLFDALLPDIMTAFKSAAGKAMDVNEGRLFRLLRRPDAYKAARRRGLGTELFIAEGGSASQADRRDMETQGMYSMTGKPRNFLKETGTLSERRRRIQAKSDVYSDLITILGMNIDNFNPNDLRYERLMITADADDHGKHIASMVISHMYLLCPEFVTGGHLWLITPPFYRLNHARDTQRKSSVYLRDGMARDDWMIRHLHASHAKLSLTVPGTDTSLPIDDMQAYWVIYRAVSAVSEAIRIASAELSIDPFVMEMLLYVSQHLTERNPNIDAIREAYPACHVRYMAEEDALSLSIGAEDVIIPLMNVQTAIYQRIMPLMAAIGRPFKLRWQSVQFRVTSPVTATYRNTPVSLMELRSIWDGLESTCVIGKLKGIGSMKPDDMQRSCLDPHRRMAIQIKEIGDVDRIYRLMGSDPKSRKELLVASPSDYT